MVVTSVVGESKPIRSISKTELSGTESHCLPFHQVVFGLPGNDEENKIDLNYLPKQDRRKKNRKKEH